LANTTSNLPSTVINVAYSPPYGISWTNPNNIKLVGSGSATATFAEADASSDYIVAQNFGFSITAGSVINGVIVVALGDDDFVFDSEPLEAQPTIQLYNGSAFIGASKSSIYLNGSEGTAGSSTDLWSTTTLSAGLCNTSGFGVGFSVFSGVFDVFPCSANIDYVKMQIYFTLPGGKPQVQTGCGELVWWLKR
jgi:hypothetical protein